MNNTGLPIKLCHSRNTRDRESSEGMCFPAKGYRMRWSSLDLKALSVKVDIIIVVRRA